MIDVKKLDITRLDKTALKLSEKIGVDKDEANKIVLKAVAGGEITPSLLPDEWLEKRFLPNCVFIDEEGYSQMCIDALKILSKTAPTDYGASRQRDLGQLWADMTRGYLGELAFTLLLEKKWGIQSKLGHHVGELEEFLPLDIHEVKKKDEEFRTPKINIGIKATKWNGIWLDIPGDQFNHSDIHILVKVGTGRDHLFAFFKKISVFKDKVLKKGEEVGVITPEESSEMFENLPTFKPIPAYICGFVPKDKKYKELNYTGKKGRKNYSIKSWNGPFLEADLDTIKEKEKVEGSVSFEGIGSFAHDKAFLFNTGNLLWDEKDWAKVIGKL